MYIIQCTVCTLLKKVLRFRFTCIKTSCILLTWFDTCWGVEAGLTALYCCTVLYCTVLYCTVLYCTVLYCTVLYCTVLYCSYTVPTLFLLYCTVLYCTVLYCTVLYWIVLYCIAPVAAESHESSTWCPAFGHPKVRKQVNYWGTSPNLGDKLQMEFNTIMWKDQ